MISMNAISIGMQFRRFLRLLAAVACCLVLGLAGATSRSHAAPAEHEAAACSACHGAGGESFRQSRAGIERTCLVCHEVELRRGNPATHAEVSGNCLTCHAFHSEGNVSPPAAEADFASLGPNAASDHCVGCHADGASLAKLSPGHLAAAALYHRDRRTLRGLTPSQACLLCHGETPSPEWVQELDTEPIPLNRHASHPFGVAVSPGDRTEGMPVRSAVDSRIPLFSGRMECTSCHLVSAGRDDLLRPFPAQYDLCLGCHTRGGGSSTDPASWPVAWAGVDR